MNRPATVASLLLPTLLCSSLLWAQDQEKGTREPFLRVRLEDKAALANNPRLLGCWKTARAVAAEMKATERLDVLEAAWSELPTPVEVFGILDGPDRTVYGVVMPPTEFSFSDSLSKAGEPTPVTIGGATWAETKSGRERLLEGDRGGRHVILFETQAKGEAAAAVDDFFAATERRSPATRRLQNVVPPGACTVLLNIEQVLAAASQQAQMSLGLVKTMLGAKFAGLTLGIQPTEQRLAVEVHADLLPNQGMLAGLIARDAEGPGLAAWLPDDAQEFANLRMSMEGIAKLARFGAGFAGASFDPADWDESFARLRGTDALAFLEEHLTGELQFLTVPSKVDTVFDLDAAGPVVAMFGAADGVRCFEAVRKLLEQVDGAPAIAADAAFGEGVYTVADDGEVQGRIVARAPFLAFAPADETSVAMLRAMLATRGEGKGPAALRERLPAGEAAPVGLALGHVLSSVEGRFAMAAMRGQPSERDLAILKVLVAALQQNFAGDAGMVASRVEAGPHGLRAKMVW